MATNVNWARCLDKSQLGGVIFGCTNSTMEECLTSQLFGLPAKHFLYVKNIEPGLPLFLFNYSERKLYGIYEAASSGKMNIDSYAWTQGGSDRTKYPAQVKIRVRMKCQALGEHQFKPIIADNYYSPILLWFELDHTQSNNLLSKLSSSAVGPKTLAPKYTKKWTASVKTSTLRVKREEKGASEQSSLTDDTENSRATSDDSQCLDADDNQLNEPSLCNQNNEMTQYDEKDILYMKLKELALSGEFLDANMTGNVVEAACTGNADVGHEKNDNAMTSLGKWNDESTFSSLDYPAIVSQLCREMEEVKASKQQQDLKMENLEKKLVEAEQKIYQLENRCMIMESESHPSATLSSNEARIGVDEAQMNLNKSIFIVGGYDGVSWSAALDSFSPSHNILRSHKPMSAVRAYASVAKLNGELYVFGGGTDSMWYDTVESYNAVEDEWTARPSLNAKKGCLAAVALDGKFYSIGGGNEMDCFSDVEMLDPNVGRWVSARSMLQKRFALASVECQGALYAVGGFDGNDYLKSAERYDPREHYWTEISSMHTRRGGHSLVVLNNRLYAIGGHDGEKTVPIVEIYDPRVGSWIPGEPMNQCRVYLAAARLKDTIYAIGGLKAGSDIVDMIECYKEGRGWQVTNLRSARNKCYASAIVLGED
ncbi:hypothetical protein OROMI_011832 [Orobanche minor]